MIAALNYSPETWVALGTAALAAATFLLAVLTGVMARAARAEIAVTVRPLIVDAPLGVFMQEQHVPWASVPLGQAFPRDIVDRARTNAMANDGAVEVSFTVRNAGSGPGLVTSSRIDTHDGSKPELDLSHTMIPLGEPAVVTARWTVGDDYNGGAKQYLNVLPAFDVTIAYSDMTGRQRLRSVLHVAGETDDAYGPQWAVERVTLYREPTLVSRLLRRKPKPFAQLSRHSTP